MGLNTFVALALLITGADAQMTPYNLGQPQPSNFAAVPFSVPQPAPFQFQWTPITNPTPVVFPAPVVFPTPVVLPIVPTPLPPAVVPAPVTAAPVTPAPVFIYVPPPDTCARDPTCFDEKYNCNSCCATGLSSSGFTCWGGGYSSTRCCKNAAPAAPPTGTFAPTAFPIVPPPVVFRNPEPDVCAKDPTCFDQNYVCKRCCASGLSEQGTTCWDAQFTKERCCQDFQRAVALGTAEPLPTTPTPTTFPLHPLTCARDQLCFDKNYQCDSCCRTGRALNGMACWVADYNPQRCCVAPVKFTSPPTFATASPTFPASTPSPSSLPTLLIVQPPPAPVCVDRSPFCGVWRATGECTGIAQVYVRNNCCLSCQGARRSGRSGERDSSVDTDTADNEHASTGLLAVVSVSAGIVLIGLVVVIVVVTRHRKRQQESNKPAAIPIEAVFENSALNEQEEQAIVC